MKQLRSALIGLGDRTEDYYVPAIQTSKFSQLVAVCDINNKKINKYKNYFKVRGYEDYQQLIEQEELDLLVVVTPHNQYKNIIDLAACQKISILKEKPFAINLSEGIYLMEICKLNQVQLMTTLQRRLYPIYRKFFDYIEKIGQPFKIEAKYTLFKNDIDQGWRANKHTSGGGCILDMGYHIIDLIIWYFGLPDQVHAEFSATAKPTGHYNVEDTADIMFRYHNGLFGSLTLSRYRYPKTEFLEIVGSQGTIYISSNQIRLLSSSGDLLGSFSKNDFSISINPIDYFCQVIKGDKENFGCPEYHLNHLSFIEACYASQYQGGYVSPKSMYSQFKINSDLK